MFKHPVSIKKSFLLFFFVNCCCTTIACAGPTAGKNEKNEPKQHRCEKIIKKTVSTIEKGGVILIHDFILNNSMDSPLFPALFSLNMLAGTPSGRAYSEEQLMNMLESEGVKDIKRLPLDLPNDSGVIMGTIL